MNYANIITQEIKDALPNVMVSGTETITGADITHWAILGWRRVVQIDTPAAGFRVGTYLAVELDGLTCKMTVATSVNIAEEQAAIAAALAAALAAQLAETKALAKTLTEGGTNLTHVSGEAVARLLLACQAVNVSWIMQIAPRVTGAPQKTGASYIAEINAAIDAQT